MSNLLELTKVDFLGSFDIRKKNKKTGDQKATSFKIILTTIVLLGVILSTLYSLIFVGMFKEGNQELYYPVMMFAGLTGLITLTTSVVKVKAIFTGKDYEMLKTLPVKKTEIVASKILSLYMVELLYSALILVPNTIIVTIFSGNLLYVLSGILLTILSPAVPMLLSVVLAMFISLVADRYKFGNVINVIFYLILFGAIFLFSFMMNTGSRPDENGQLDMTTYINMANVFGWFNPSTQLIKLSFTLNPLFLIVYVVANALLICGVVSFIALLFDKVHSAINTTTSNEVYVAKNLEQKGQFKTLFFHETKRFFTSKFYFINSLASGICAIMMAGMMGFMFSPYSTMIPVTSEEYAFFSHYAYVGFLIIIFGIGIATPAGCSISIEGKNFWILKTAPIDYKKLLKAKFLLSFLVLGVCALIAGIVLCIFLNASIFSYIATPILSLAFTALASIISLKINVKRPKLKWNNEQECVKNSSAMILSMFADWGIMIILTIVTVGLSFINIYLACAVSLAIMAIWTFIEYNSLIKNADRYFNQIEEF